MKRYLLLIIAITIFLCSCNNNKTGISNILNPDHLATQTFSLNINRDTTLVTSSNCIIKIPKGSLASDSQDIKLEIKEALNNTDIVLAGLTTLSGKQALSSGGMMYINAATGYKVSIKKELEVLIPTKDYKADMNVFKGVDSAGKINWADPQPLPKDPLQLNIETGKQLFKAKCANCHKPEADYTGPALAGITKRSTLQWIYHFIWNPAGMSDPESMQVKDKWKPTVMTAFANLSPTDINNILTYIETAGDKNWKVPDQYFAKDSAAEAEFLCVDSCYKYRMALEEVANKRVELEADADDFFTLDQTIPVPPQTQPVNTNTDPPIQIQQQEATPEKETVQPSSIKATFYTINIKAFGWWNIDILLKERSNCSPSELFVRLQGNYEADFQVMLMVPSVKAFVQGGKLKDGKQYGFDETNGKIPLPQNAPCYIIAFAEVGDKLIFGKASFFAQLSQTIDISFSETTKEGLANQIKTLKLDGIGAEVKDSKNAENIKTIERITTEADKLKPKNCNCELPGTASSDTTAINYSLK
ncbi:MAG: cytochrome c [Ferruginibacter sp.]